MTSAKDQSKLERLAPRERQVLRLWCAGHKYRVIGLKLEPPIPENTVKAHMLHISEKLELMDLPAKDRKPILKRLCPHLENRWLMVLPQPEDEPVDPDPEPEEQKPGWGAIMALDNAEPPPPPPPPEPPRLPGSQQPRKAGCGSTVWAGLAGALLMLLLVGLIWLWRGGQISTAPSTTESPSPAHTAAQPTWTAVVLTQIVVVTATPEPATTTPVASETLPPPTHTAAPTATPMPTSTATPALALPFEDNFDNGLRPEWVVTDGDFVITNGWLAATDQLSLLIGDASLTEYVLEFDYDSIYYNYLIEVYFARLLRLELFMYSVTWQTNEGLGSPTWHTQGQEFSEAGRRGHLRVEVSGNTATTYIHGQQVDSRTFSQPLAAPLVVELPETDAMIDNFRISSP